MKVRYLVIVLIMALVAVGSVSKVFSRAHSNYVVAEETSSDDAGDEGEYTEFA